MVKRYGNVILFSPAFNAASAWLWLMPAIGLLAGVVIAVRVVRQRRRLVEQDDSVVDAEEGSR